MQVCHLVDGSLLQWRLVDGVLHRGLVDAASVLLVLGKVKVANFGKRHFGCIKVLWLVKQKEVTNGLSR